MPDWIEWKALFGGVLLGISAVLLLLINGKIAGISGILNGALSPVKGDALWRVLFIAGLVFGGGISVFWLDQPKINLSDINLPLLLAAGFLVGLGTRLANGCTSGHGICGIGRLSVRSIMATCTFMLVAGLTVFVHKHLL